ncbi:MAG: hypothetical protein K2X73_15230 [Sphingomonas sp.]|jgi:hypothetical protein|uniref:hypothetical protein n=1 Tax=Sphingomonas sp. TaxID=28214 RepID=UPI0025FCC264|nr:hypothetical protein [Sphingomonas sp.]MBX9883304.1 hypothetical protein [Sphingomonas sp.]
MVRALLLLLLLAGCAGRRDYPSLLPRTIETRNDAEPVRPAAIAQPDSALDAKIAEARAALERSAKSFTPYAERATGLVARAKEAPAGSEAWLDAQAALADLDILRAESSARTSDLELLTIERAAAVAPPYPALDAAYAEAKAQLEAQEARITALTQQLPTK